MAPLRVVALALPFVLAAVKAAAHQKPSTPELSARAESGGAIASSRAALFRAYAIARPERLPARS